MSIVSDVKERVFEAVREWALRLDEVEAKRGVARDVPIDLPGGPSEVVVLGDGDPELIELELAAQREHGHDAVCRTVDTLEEAEVIAPEHLVLLGDAERDVDRVRNAGTVFVGPWSPVPAG